MRLLAVLAVLATAPLLASPTIAEPPSPSPSSSPPSCAPDWSMPTKATPCPDGAERVGEWGAMRMCRLPGSLTWHGWQESWELATKAAERLYCHGHRHGRWRTWDVDGEPLTVECFDNGTAVTCPPALTTALRAPLQDACPHRWSAAAEGDACPPGGEVYDRTDASGYRQRACLDAAGVRHGWRLEWAGSRQIVAHGYCEGRPHGRWRTWALDGTPLADKCLDRGVERPCPAR